MNSKKQTFVFVLTGLFMLLQLTFAKDTITKSSSPLDIDSAKLIITCMDSTVVAKFSVVLYGSGFDDGELVLRDQETPFEMEIPAGNFRGIVNTNTIEKPVVKVQVAEYKDGGLALRADRPGHRLLVRRRGNWAAVEQLN